MSKLEYLKVGTTLKTRNGLSAEVIKTGTEIGPEFERKDGKKEIKFFDIVVIIKFFDTSLQLEYDFIDWYSSEDFVPSEDGKSGVLKSPTGDKDYDLIID